VLLSLLIPGWILAQIPGPSLRGQVLDPSGAAVPGITVTLTGPKGLKLAAQTDEQGKYAFRKLAPGAYTLLIQLKGFSDFEKTGIVIGGPAPVVNAQLSVETQKQQVTVTDETTKITVNPSENASSLTIKGKDLESLSDDPDELQSELEALAGPSAGPNGGQVYIDGFTGGQLPPKSSIREIRVNQNPFSAQYDSLGYGRIEILTKPGTEKYHGEGFVSGNDSAFNTRNPFASQIPGYHSEIFDGNFGGTIGKKTSFFVDAQRRNILDESIVNAIILDQNLNQVSLSQTVPTPQKRTNFSPRIDTQIGNNNTFSFRYQLWDDNEQNTNVGQFTLPSAAYGYTYRNQTFQISDAQVINEKAVTEIRFRFYRTDYHSIPASALPTVSVSGAFTGGGTSAGTTDNLSNSYELQNYTSVSLHKHFVKFGARFRDTAESSNSTSGFNGVFRFPSIQAYQITEQGLQAGLTSAQIQANGGGPSQFQLTVGNPLANVNYYDLEPYVEDDWKVRPNLTVSGGLRFETQNHIHDHADFAPRIGIAWGLGGAKSAKTVLRAGFGMFYDRFGQGNILNALRLNGITQQQYIVASPTFFPNIPLPSTLAAISNSPTTYQIDPNLRSPYTAQSGIGVERQLTRNATFSVTYLNTHGVHQFLTRNINAPNPANPPSTPRPDNSAGNLYQYESAGLFNQNQMIANFSLRGSRFSLYGFYTLSFVNSNTAGTSSFPLDQYNLNQNYGRAAYDVRDRVFLGGSWNLPKGFQLFPFVVMNSPGPFNITLGQDLNGDSIYNDRPAFASSLSNPANVVNTRWGKFDTMPVAGETIIPINYGVGFGQFTTNLRLSKTFGFGREVGSAGTSGGGGPMGGRGGGRHGGSLGGGGLSSMGTGGGPFGGGARTGRRYNLTFSVSARNIFNTVNDASPVGTLSSPIFGRPNALQGGFFSSSAANRRIDMQVRFVF
jgi:hypothetical protein